MRASSAVESSGLVSNTLKIPVLLRGQPQVLQLAFQQRPEALMREPEQVTEVRLYQRTSLASPDFDR
jgi:hypothetical protein